MLKRPFTTVNIHTYHIVPFYIIPRYIVLCFEFDIFKVGWTVIGSYKAFMVEAIELEQAF